MDLTATVSAIKAERETRPVRIVAAGFLIKKAPAEADAFSEKTLGAEASLPCASTPKTAGALATCRFVPMTRVERCFSALAFRCPSDVRFGSFAATQFVRFLPEGDIRPVLLRS